MAQNTYGNSAGGLNALALENRKIYQLTLIKVALSKLILFDDADKETIALHTGGFASGEIQFRRFSSLPVDTTPLAELDEPSDLSLSMGSVTTNLQRYAGKVRISDVLADAGIDNVMDVAVQRLGERAGTQAHLLLIAALEGGVGSSSTWASGANLMFGGSATSVNTLTTSDKLTVSVLQKARRELEVRNIETFPDGTYHAAFHPYQIHDLRSDSLWQDLSRYNGGSAQGGNSIVSGMAGEIMGIKIRTSTDLTNATSGGAGANVPYAKGFVYGPHAFGVFDFKSMVMNTPNAASHLGIRVDYEAPGKSSKADTTGSWGYAAYKFAMAAKTIDPDRIQGVTTAYSA